MCFGSGLISLHFYFSPHLTHKSTGSNWGFCLKNARAIKRQSKKERFGKTERKKVKLKLKLLVHVVHNSEKRGTKHGGFTQLIYQKKSSALP